MELIVLVASLCVVGAAPPSSPRLYSQAEQYRQVNPLDFYLDNPDITKYYQQDQKHANSNSDDSAPARLETLEPDSEVELIPGAQPPQQPPQQSPVAPNLPGLIPGQRVFIVHMPVPGIRPGTVGGYQPVYIVGAAPQANAGYPGYQNPILLDPSGQVSPLAYPRQAVAGFQNNPNLALGGFGNQPFNFAYQQPILSYQQVQQPNGEVPTGALRFSNVVAIQGQMEHTNEARQNSDNSPNAELKSQVNVESKKQTKNASLAHIKNKS